MKQRAVGRRWLGVVAALLLAAPAGADDGVPAVAPWPLLAPLAGAASAPPSPWRVVGLPTGNKPLTQFSLETLQGRRVLRIESERAYANLLHDLPHGTVAHTLAWQWQIELMNTAADLHTRQGDDTTVKVCALYDEPLDQVPWVDRTVLRLARAATHEPLPAATVCYVWDDRLPVGTVLPSAYTRRLRYVVLESGPADAALWHHEQRDLAADFLHAFGDETGVVPPLLAIGIGADSDNTQSHSIAHVSDLVLSP